MSDGKYRPLTSAEKLELAQEVNALIDLHYPQDQFYVEPEVLLLALIARTNSSERQNLAIRFNQ